ncbi:MULTISPECIES: M13 family metallopeptidase [unclassified Rhodanobacter]|uniref:M13 family metallopeptidase n=1 Tax=unclassified Rhodanobacter TaxID=2621553 RepID=UPI0007AA1986|nr:MULTISPECIES: M13-type metalloendopeptidase [unclassified Rhodanobacter]KZC16473.1 peptidase [Rhodanobacter sp. FW104-R8]KZC28841.1 peptidase [Rhodanobacter sp. FW510-T8]KZC31487.1 peptidase [Rhodanobacter sp. FW510-R10]
MTKQYLKPLALALAVSAALSLSACGKQEPAAKAPAPASTAPAAAGTTAAANPGKSIFDVSELDPSINACQDFNGFVNAKWVAANPIPADRTRWGAFDQLAESSLNTQHAIVEKAAKGAATAPAGSIEQKIGLLFQSGMDEAAIEKAGFDPIKPKLNAIAGLKNGGDVADYITKSYVEGDGQVFQFGSSADFQHADMQIAYAFEAGLGLPTKDYYSDAKYKDIRDAYVAYIAKALELTGVAEADARKQADDVLAFETRLAAASLSPVEARKPENQYHFVSVKDADKATPHFSWDKFFAAQGVTVDKGFSLSQPKFFAEFDQQLAKAPISQWQAYLRFHTIDDASPYLSKNFQDNKFDFYGKTLAGQPEQKVRWKRVLGTVNSSMGQALGQLYVAEVFKPEAKARAQELVDNVRNALKARIQNLDWMSDETKAKAIAKWDTFLPKIGYPDKWRDWSGLNVTGDSYYANVQAANKFNYDYDIAKIGKPTDRKEWGMTPQTVNAYYNPTDNTINFPAAILQPPFFDARADDAVNYGGIGAVIGHEASHGFDDEGSQFDGAGNNKNWWTKDDRAKFDARTDKLVAQFDEYAPIKDKPDAHVNGKLTLGENIADLGGLNVAYDALQAALKKNPEEAGKQIDGYTQDQRFFLNWARVWRGHVREKQALLSLNVDPHAPAALRAIGAPSNMPAFASAFQCKPGDTMVRADDKQVKIW